jgi:hypothetical protein
MLRNRTHSSITAPITTSCLVAASIGMLAVTAPRAHAVDYQIVASGPLVSAISDSSTFNGTTHGTLPPLLDLAALAGGSFSATFRFSTVTPDPGDSAFYELDPASGITFDLLNSSGAVVHHGSQSSDPIAIIENDSGNAPFTVDQVFLAANVNNISGANIPVPIYTPPGDFFPGTDLSFFGNVAGGAQYVTDLGIPTDPATYLAFPDRVFDLVMSFGDGDYFAQVGPFQRVDTTVQYQITSLSVTAVPEPGVMSLVLAGLAMNALRRSRGQVNPN